MSRIEHIEKMEKILDEHTEILAALNENLDRFLAVQKQYQELREYYGSEQFMKDFEASNHRQLPENLKCGVLSEDAVFDLIADNFQTSIKMLEIATVVIKEN